jgi:hypothetical protein
MYHHMMAADPIIYCLEHVTDYRDFERFCSVLLANASYPGIDPLGGTGDEGRDAIIWCDATGRKITFAYTVRADWRAKLASDCKQVQAKGHAPQVFVFVCTEALSASEKDFAQKFVADRYSWTLDLFDLERLRVQVAGPQRFLIEQHPSIFPPRFFPQQGISIAYNADTPFVKHAAAEQAREASKRSNDVGCVRLIIGNCDFFNVPHFTDQAPNRFGAGIFSRESLIEPYTGGRIHFYDTVLATYVSTWWQAWDELIELTGWSFDLTGSGGIYYPVNRHFPNEYPTGSELEEMQKYLASVDEAAGNFRRAYRTLLLYVREAYPDALLPASTGST